MPCLFILCFLSSSNNLLIYSFLFFLRFNLNVLMLQNRLIFLRMGLFSLSSSKSEEQYFPKDDLLRVFWVPLVFVCQQEGTLQLFGKLLMKSKRILLPSNGGQSGNSASDWVFSLAQDSIVLAQKKSSVTKTPEGRLGIQIGIITEYPSRTYSLYQSIEQIQVKNNSSICLKACASWKQVNEGEEVGESEKVQDEGEVEGEGQSEKVQDEGEVKEGDFIAYSEEEGEEDVEEDQLHCKELVLGLIHENFLSLNFYYASQHGSILHIWVPYLHDDHHHDDVHDDHRHDDHRHDDHRHDDHRHDDHRHDDVHDDHRHDDVHDDHRHDDHRQDDVKVYA